MNSPTVTEAGRRSARKRADDGGVSRGRMAAKAVGSKSAAAEAGEHGSSGSLVQQAIRAVGNYMRDNGLRPGDTLPGEKYFGDELGVSRAVMREAFGALGALQIIDVARGRKPKVSHVDGSLFATSIVHGFNTSQISILDVWEVRKTVELRATEMAATARTDEELKEIQDIVEAIAVHMDDPDLVSQYNAEFHYAIARASHNVLFAQILASFAPITRIATRAAWKACTTKAMKQTQVTRHKAIVRAIARKDPEAATDAMRQLFDDAIRENWSRLAAHRFSFDPFFEQGQRPALI
ncbi:MULTISPECIES: FadR/GntR family transcriptional regulator [unclassified Sphingomonas]|uniref:FadR/GntR family transcriptional regulator n=1 Tax=unclassified Sphingomonas TaxID=196159 RepID=UPI00070044CE|nr:MULTISPECIES: FCD domain-containing protein [unclassified Sphingomonas]KQX19647.1 GntR family transcriptional regulator [Sphingomonas sp. Root1294]KQY65848.1 GntR family transcriptional regulator [Sphingomonas sp. Root50]KRB94845.1 GntR family transcriptional regulator [Sphingomonas sp. Root720]